MQLPASCAHAIPSVFEPTQNLGERRITNQPPPSTSEHLQGFGASSHYITYGMYRFNLYLSERSTRRVFYIRICERVREEC